MSLYGLSQRTTATAAASASWEVRSASTNKPRLMEMGISQVTAVAGTYGMGRPAAIGVTPLSYAADAFLLAFSVCFPSQRISLCSSAQ